MNLSGLSFILFFLKWSADKGFRHKLRVTDNITYQKLLQLNALKRKSKYVNLILVY